MALSSGETDPVLRNLMDIMYNNNNTNDEHMVPNGLKRPESSSLSSVPVPLPLPPQLMSTSTSKAPPRAPPMTTLTARRPPSRVGKQTSSFHTLMKQEEIRHQRKILEIRRAHEGPKERTERNMLAISQLPEFQKHAIPMRNYMFNKILVGYANNKQIAGHIIDQGCLAELQDQIRQDEQNLHHCLSTLPDSRVDVRQLAWDYLHSRAKEEARKLWQEVRNVPTLLQAIDEMLLSEEEHPDFPNVVDENNNNNKNDNRNANASANTSAKANEPFMWEPPPIPPMY
ncbi:hypothetical protein H2204_009540 [Knufia peltigerae]|uniref:Uncharacterized protein n=1 Tax=Knufia peltigerae TaxID=1002370 RepID=A0AA38XXX8_9EURO|nr:hypothetical protein H2204_009540 [Knufia peltigerae]